MEFIRIPGARTHELKNINLDIVPAYGAARITR